MSQPHTSEYDGAPAIPQITGALFLTTEIFHWVLSTEIFHWVLSLTLYVILQDRSKRDGVIVRTSGGLGISTGE